MASSLGERQRGGDREPEMEGTGLVSYHGQGKKGGGEFFFYSKGLLW